MFKSVSIVVEPRPCTTPEKFSIKIEDQASFWTRLKIMIGWLKPRSYSYTIPEKLGSLNWSCKVKYKSYDGKAFEYNVTIVDPKGEKIHLRATSKHFINIEPRLVTLRERSLREPDDQKQTDMLKLKFLTVPVRKKASTEGGSSRWKCLRLPKFTFPTKKTNVFSQKAVPSGETGQDESVKYKSERTGDSTLQPTSEADQAATLEPPSPFSDFQKLISKY